ncbi:glycosyltransferase family 2 protein [Butyrivibrio sp. INlla16]|uniref:glycosyltransferase family 2 protein n=1 Tax=Butyrivibrio sp. INlla16 TaxID=1520807 RepID=UPI0008836769|nr:glycosyltransferase family 2 protein [Butyrivibrio sp. INlla16]SDB37361.1 Glycosyl transferase family 2 [Butyrivibrio sp. INlla16]
MRLSVIVPVYNMAGEDKLKHCLDSLVGQTLPDGEIEIIAVDDCSADNSLELMQDYEKRYPGRFVAIHSPVNHHQGGAKNIGLGIAKGEWLGFIDADDWVVPDYYERLLKKADETGADMVGCDYSLVDCYTFTPGQIVHNNNAEQTGVMDEEKYKKLLLDTGSLVVKIYKRNIVMGDTKPVSVTENGSTLTKAYIFPEDIFYEDNAVSNTWMLRVKHFEYIEEPLYFYFQHDASTVHTVSKKNLEDRMTAGRQILAEARENGYLEKYKPEIEFMYTVLFYVNTLFSAMPKEQHIEGCYDFTKKMGLEMKEAFPGFQNNPYYLERIHAEEKKLIGMQMKSHLLFYAYYRLLWFYRNLRKKR